MPVKKPVVLLICDGWGESPETKGNAIALANTPRLNALRAQWPHTTVDASGEAVGLPAGQIGNSEVGHLTIGSGRIIRQPLSRQIHEINTGSFNENAILLDAIASAKKTGNALHIMGLLSPGGVHSHRDAAVALVKLAAAQGLTEIFVHVYTDGRDVPPTSARGYIESFEEDLAKIGAGRIASVAGRYYAMDRDNRWDRIEQAYDMLTAPSYQVAASATDYIQASYDEGIHDEFIKPTRIGAQVNIKDGDSVIFFNFRPDRARELTHALVDEDFTKFERKHIVRNLHFVTFAEYDSELKTPIAFPKDNMADTLAEVVSKAGLKQYHIAETEKYAHVTYFLNGGNEAAFAGEDRVLIPSLKIATYDLQPEMSARDITTTVVNSIKKGTYDFIALNFANADMTGHTGKLDAAISAIETLDGCIADVIDATITAGGAVLMTADHGNAEIEIDPDNGEPVTAHTTSPVPAIVCGIENISLRGEGGLQDIAPTILEIMQLEKPELMSGSSLIKH